MFRLIINICGDTDQLYITELRVQCVLAEHAYEFLSKYCQVVGERTGTAEPYPHSPIEVISHCVGFLSAIANISKILFPASRKSQGRGERLRSRLKITSLPNIESRGVRNSFEHIDERIDVLADKFKNGEICLVDIAESRGKETIVLKRLDPKGNKIEFLDQSIDVAACYAEMKLIEGSL